MKNNFISKPCFLIIALCISLFNLRAQLPNAANFNTASDAPATGTLAYGTNDLNWSVSNTGISGPYIPAVVCGNQALCCWFNSTTANANWITYPHPCSSSLAEHSCSGNVDEYYKLNLNLPAANNCNEDIGSPNAYCLALNLYADNCVWEVFVNGMSVYTSSVSSPYGHAGFSGPGNTPLSLCNYWQMGSNDVIIHVKSGAPTFPGWSGFLATVNHSLTTNNSPCITGFNELAHNANDMLFPNPTNGMINFKTDLLSEKTSVEVYNGLGQLIKRQTLSVPFPGIDLANEAPGMYYLKIHSDVKQQMIKIIKE